MTIIGDKKRKYHLVKKLGAGESGTVFSARRSGRKHVNAVLKVGAEKKVKAEAAVLKELRGHENIAGLRHWGYDEKLEQWFMELHFAKGGDLLQHVMTKPFSEEDAKPIVYDLLQAVRCAHKQGIAHRDIKLENVLLADKAGSRAMLADWDLAGHFDGDKLLHEECGSLYYAAPEILAGNGYLGWSVDIWSTGILIYALISGRFPFNSTAINGRFRDFALAGASVPLPGYFSASLCSLLRRMLLITRPSLRIPAAEALKHPWFDSLFSFDSDSDAEADVHYDIN